MYVSPPNCPIVRRVPGAQFPNPLLLRELNPAQASAPPRSPGCGASAEHPLPRYRTERDLPDLTSAPSSPLLAFVQQHIPDILSCRRFDRFCPYTEPAKRPRLPTVFPDGSESMRRCRLTPVRIDEHLLDVPGCDGHTFITDLKAYCTMVYNEAIYDARGETDRWLAGGRHAQSSILQKLST